MALKPAVIDRERDKFGEKPDGQTAVHTIATIDNLDPIVVSSGIITSWTRQVVSVSTTPVALNPDANQLYIRIVPLADGNFFYGPDSGINSTNSEVFSKAAPIEITIDSIVYIVKETGTANVVIYRGSSA